MNASLTAALPTGLVGYRPDLENDILAFQREAFPERPYELHAPRWRWMFLESARRLGASPMVWFYRKPAGIVAQQGAIPVRLQVEGREFTTGWFVETMVLPSVRNGAIGPGVIAKAKNDLPFNLSLGQTAQMRAIQLQTGWRRVEPLRTLMFPLRPSDLLRHRLTNPLARGIVAAGLSTRQNLKRALRERPGWKVQAAEIDAFDERHDRLWEEVRRSYPCAVVRDASFLNWKFVSQPGQSFVRLEIRRNGRPAALAVLVVREPETVYLYRRALLVDLVVEPNDRQTIVAAFDTARRAALDRQCDSLVFHVIDDRLLKAAAAFGFLEREATRFLLISPGDAPEDTARAVLDGRRWFVTMADSDIDRPVWAAHEPRASAASCHHEGRMSPGSAPSL